MQPRNFAAQPMYLYIKLGGQNVMPAKRAEFFGYYDFNKPTLVLGETACPNISSIVLGGGADDANDAPTLPSFLPSFSMLSALHASLVCCEQLQHLSPTLASHFVRPKILVSQFASPGMPVDASGSTVSSF